MLPSCFHTVPAAAALCCSLTVGAPLVVAAEVGTRTFNLPRGDASTTLKEFAATAGIPIVYLLERVRGTTTQSVKGEFTPRAALERMLAGSGLEAVQDAATGAFVVSRIRSIRSDARSVEDGPIPTPPSNSRIAPMTSPRTLLAVLAGWLTLGAAADAQTKAAPPAEETVVLSPFTVSSDKDRGYAATSTLSGTRLNTSLRDTAAAVSVITPELLQDLGLNNINEIANFMVASESDPGNGNGANFNKEQNQASTIRVRGLAISTNQANFFTIPWTIDSYSVERITQTRGPNSLLFGVGNSPGGLSSTTKRADANRKSIGLHAAVAVDSNEGKRYETDLHVPVLPGRLALRIAGLDERRRGFLDYDQRDERRLFATATLKVADNRNYRATLHGFGEWAQADRLLPDVSTPIDYLTPWLAAGRPLVAGTASAGNAANLPAGTQRASAAARLVLIDGGSTAVPALNWINTARGAPANSSASQRFGPDSPVPLDINYRGPANASNYAGRVLQLLFEQTFFNAVSVELASSRTDWSLFWVRGAGAQLFADVNQNLPNGQANPNVGRIYIEDTYRLQDELRTSAEDRATLAYRFDGARYSPWLGSWVFSCLVNRSDNDQGLDDLFEYNATPLPGFSSTVSNNTNRIVRRTYILNGSGDVWLPSAVYGRNLPPVSAPGVTPVLKNTRSVSDRTEIQGWTFGTQAKLLRERLALIYGHRHDEVKRYTASPIARADGFFDHWDTYATPLATQLESETQTFGVVGHVLPWLSAFYNKSESIDLAAPRLGIFGVGLPIPSGSGKDYGFKLSWLDNRLNVTLSRFDSGTLNLQNNPSNNLPANVGLIEDATGRSINILNRNEQPPDTLDTVTKGYELEVTCNPTENWRIVANATKQNAVSSNVSLRYKRFLEERVFPLESTYGNIVTANGQTVTLLMNAFRNQLASFHTAREGAAVPELREWTGNLITSFAITRGVLRGVSFGGYAQYRGPNVLALRVDAAGNAIPAERIMGNSDINFGVHFRYECKLRPGARYSIQLNIFNLFDADMLVRKAVDPTSGGTTAWGYRQPRTFRLTNTLSF